MQSNVLKVLIVDDSPTARNILTHVINREPDIHVIGEAANGRQAIKLTTSLHPDIILMDIFMPEMDGLEAIQEIMHTEPTPIVVMSGGDQELDSNLKFKAISGGALTAIKKLPGPRDPNYPDESKALVNTLRSMAAVRVIHRWKAEAQPKPVMLGGLPPQLPFTPGAPKIVAIVASTGGPSAINEILQRLPSNFPLPIVIVQHITADFIPSLIDWLKTITTLEVALARQGGLPVPGTVYIAPGDTHLRLTRGLRFDLNRNPETLLHIPSGDVFLSSVAQAYGTQAIGVVLTGMGDDGARGLREMYDKGACTLAQDEATSVVYGMPQQATVIGAVQKIVPISLMANVLIELVKAR
jgi:two-component system chemotaxis response regulator CheB